jgi:hypothetical protein
MRDLDLTLKDRKVPVTATGNRGFAESRKTSAKAIKPSAKALPTVALGTGLTENFFSATALCRAPELEALGTSCAESSQWAVDQKKVVVNGRLS